MPPCEGKVFIGEIPEERLVLCECPAPLFFSLRSFRVALMIHTLIERHPSRVCGNPFPESSPTGLGVSIAETRPPRGISGANTLLVGLIILSVICLLPPRMLVQPSMVITLLLLSVHFSWAVTQTPALFVDLTETGLQPAQATGIHPQ